MESTNFSSVLTISELRQKVADYDSQKELIHRNNEEIKSLKSKLEEALKVNTLEIDEIIL